MIKKISRPGIAALALIVCAVLLFAAVAVASPVRSSEAADVTSSDGKYYSAFDTYDEALKAAEDLNRRVDEEGIVLLKNQNNALPVKTGSTVSVFGVAQSTLVDGAGSVNNTDGGTLGEALEAEGYKVNPTLRNFYESSARVTDSGFNVPGSQGYEYTDFSNTVDRSIGLYNDMAVLVFGRHSAEGSDKSMNTGEAEDEKAPDGSSYGWTHKQLAKNAEGNIYKHQLQLTDREEALIEFVKDQGFGRIVVVLNTSATIEIGNLEDDPAIDGIAWIGGPGAMGYKTLAKIISGEVNPSGKTTDLWQRDFTLDPTWQNFGNNRQTGSTHAITINGKNISGAYTEGDNNWRDGNFGLYKMDYEEGLYFGYKLYETAYKDLQVANGGTLSGQYNNTQYDYDYQVIYPFGYGLSYTTFSYSNMKVYTDASLSEELTGSVNPTEFATADGDNRSATKKLYVTVDVENNGERAGKEAVQIYVTAPYRADDSDPTVDKPFVSLVGFAKTDEIAPKDTETVVVEVNVQDIASYDYSDANNNNLKGYELDSGEYVIRAMGNSHAYADPDSTVVGYDEAKFTLSGDAYLKYDDYADREVGNKFSTENGVFDSMRTADFTVTDNDPMTLLTRSTLTTAYPVAPEYDEKTNLYPGNDITDEMGKTVQFYDAYSLDNQFYGTNFETFSKDGWIVDTIYTKTNVDIDDPSMPWVQEANAAFAADGRATVNKWTQQPGGAREGRYDITLSDLYGKDPFGSAEDQKAWDDFMNQLTYTDMINIFGNYQSSSFEEIDFYALAATDRTSLILYSFHDNTVLAATFNTELAEEQGIIAGSMMLLKGLNTYWGTNVNIHRSPFQGRSMEYMSQDPILTGYIGAAYTYGGSSTGAVFYIKHCPLNEQETDRGRQNLFTFASEQAMREIYFKPFQMAVQEGGAKGMMGAFGRIGTIPVNTNYNFTTSVVRGEWNFMGSITTDAYSGLKQCCPPDLLVRAGTDTIATETLSGTWDPTLRNGLGGVMVGKKSGEEQADDPYQSDVQYYFVRKAAMWFCWVHANSAMNRQGLEYSDFKDWGTVSSLYGYIEMSSGGTPQNVAYDQGASVNITTAMKNDAVSVKGAQSVRYDISAGTLPAGLTLNGETGAITGTLTAAAGEYSFTVRMIVDHWAKKTLVFNMTVNDAFSYASGPNDSGNMSAAAVGKMFMGQLSVKGATDETVWSVSSGALPAGMTMDAGGTITGTPTESGTFEFTATATTGGTAVSKTYTIVVAEGEPSGIQMQVSDGYIQWKYEDEDEWHNIIAVSELKGEKGDTGAQGEKGDPGEPAEGGCGSAMADGTLVIVAAAVLAVGAVGGIVAFVRRRKNK